MINLKKIKKEKFHSPFKTCLCTVLAPPFSYFSDFYISPSRGGNQNFWTMLSVYVVSMPDQLAVSLFVDISKSGFAGVSTLPFWLFHPWLFSVSLVTCVKGFWSCFFYINFDSYISRVTISTKKMLVKGWNLPYLEIWRIY